MKKILGLVGLCIIFSGCSVIKPEPKELPSPTQSTESEGQLSPSPQPGVQKLVVTENNFSVDEVIAQKGETVILEVINQIDESINVVINELGVRSAEIAPGKSAMITIPTDQPGEYEMYSSLGSQREEGFSAVVTIEEIEE